MVATAHQLLVRVPLISADHKGPVVNLVAWVAMTTMCLATVTVLISKLVVLRRLTWNDSIITTAMVSIGSRNGARIHTDCKILQLFGIGFTIALNQQVDGGLGSRLPTLSETQYGKFQKAGYTWNILYIFSLFLGKASTLSLLLALSPNKTYRKPMLAVGGVVLVWTIASIFASAFQCSLPHPYLITTSKCFSQVGFWEGVGVIDIATDLALMLLPVWLVFNLQLAARKKIAVCFAFSFRSFAIACTIWRLAQLHKFFDRGTDVTFNSWLPSIATSLEVFFSIFAACVPHLRPFMDSIQAGYLSGMIQEGDGRFGYGNDSYLMGKMAQSKTAASQIRSQAMRSELRGESLDLPRQGQTDDSAERQGIGRAISSNRAVMNKVSGGKQEKVSSDRNRSNSVGSDGALSHGSTGSKAMIIKTTKEWSISYQDA
jgi:hypothetical protein